MGRRRSDGRSTRPGRSPTTATAGIRAFFWAHDNRHLLYVQDNGGDENWRLYDVDLETDEIRDLTPFDDVQARVEETDKRLPDEILVGLNVDNPQLHDVYRLDLATGELEKIVENPGFIGLVVDADFKVRGGLAPLPDGGMVGIWCATTRTSEWRPVARDRPGRRPHHRPARLHPRRHRSAG